MKSSYYNEDRVPVLLVEDDVQTLRFYGVEGSRSEPGNGLGLTWPAR